MPNHSFSIFAIIMLIVLTLHGIECRLKDDTFSELPKSMEISDNSRLQILGKISHMENSLEILYYASRRMPKAINEVEKEKLQYLVNSEWNSILENLAFISVASSIKSDSVAVTNYKRNIANLSTDPVSNNPDELAELPKSIEEVKGKIVLLRKMMGIDYTAESFFELSK